MIPALGNLKQEDFHLSQSSLGYTDPMSKEQNLRSPRPKLIALALATPILGADLARVNTTSCSVPPSLSPVFVIFSFTSVVDLVIALQEDGYMMGFMDFYSKEVVWDGWVWSWPHHARS